MRLEILKRLNAASRRLAELKGVAASMPNQGILVSTLGLQEAKDSSEIENIVTNHDELFRATGLLTNNHILQIQAELEQNHAGFRKLPGTALKSGNGRTGRIVNVLYLVKQGLLDIPVLHMSRHIVRTRADNYRLLQAVRDHGTWEDWVLYMLSALRPKARHRPMDADSSRRSGA